MLESWGCGLYTSAAYTRVFTVSHSQLFVCHCICLMDGTFAGVQILSRSSLSRISEASRLGFRSFQISITSRVSSVIYMGSLSPQENGCVVQWRAKCCRHDFVNCSFCYPRVTGNLGYPYSIIVQINNLFPDKHRQWFTGLVKSTKEISRHPGF